MSNLMPIITSISSYILIHIMSVVTHPAGTIFIDHIVPQQLPFYGVRWNGGGATRGNLFKRHGEYGKSRPKAHAGKNSHEPFFAFSPPRCAIVPKMTTCRVCHEISPMESLPLNGGRGTRHHTSMKHPVSALIGSSDIHHHRTYCCNNLDAALHRSRGR